MSTKTAILLAAHGSQRDPAANARIERLAADLASRGIADEVNAGFHQGEPGFTEALNRLEARRVLVIPLFTSEGYYTSEVLPRALRASDRYATVSLTQTRPIGTHPGLFELVRDRVTTVARLSGFDLQRTSLLIVGHGTRRHAGSRAATDRVVESLAAENIAAEIVAAFLDDEPDVETAALAVTQPTTLVVPFLIGGSSHAAEDLPRRLGLSERQLAQPIEGIVGSRHVVLDIPIGAYDGLVDLIIEIASAELPEINAGATRRQGTVTLVGAGPGDPDLITVKGRAFLRTADVVLYDRLIAPELLLEARPDAHLIDVGKLPGGGGASQQQINRLIIAYATAGRTVVRLKGGDPFVFGRGSEEVEACREAGIPCAVVPGISSAIAVPAAAGIPVTARGEARSFAVVTGQDSGGLPEAVTSLGGNQGIETLVLLMGRSVLRELTDTLIAAGRDPLTPAACIQDGTTSRQRVTVATLATLADAADRDGLVSPLVTVIGEVARHAEGGTSC